MTFENEDVRHLFHQLPTQTQYDWMKMDEDQALGGNWLHVESVTVNADGTLEVCIRIHQKSDKG